MSDRTPTAVFKAKNADLLDEWEAETSVLWQEYQQKTEEWLASIGKTQAISRKTYGGVFITGYGDEDPKTAPLPGFRVHSDNKHFRVPALRTKIGKEQERALSDVRYSPRRPGVPELVWGEGFMGGVTVKKVNGTWFAYTTVPLGDRDPNNTGLNEFDPEMWEECKLSEYFLAVESEQEKSE